MKLRLLALVLLVALPVFAKKRVVRHPAPPAAPTFSNEVVRILQQRCQSCHREGDIAPFPLMTYADAQPRSALIKFMTGTRQMPPWKADEGCGAFLDERRLSDAEVATLAQWVEAGSPEGDPAQLPPPREFPSDWRLGEPDLILANEEAFTPPEHRDTYRCFSLPTRLTENRFVSAIDTHPGDRTTVHHVIAFVDPTGASAALDEADPGPGYTCFGGPGVTTSGSLGGWGPGSPPLELPENVAFALPAAARVILQVHYHPHHSQPSPDRTEFGIYFSTATSPKELRFLPVINTTFTIPPNDSHYRVDGAFPIAVPLPLKLWLIAPHMHLLGKEMTVYMQRPDSSTECLIRIDDWDFNWQGAYRYIDPIDIPAGSRLTLTSYFDNSSSNPLNPNNPPKAVSWGEATTDEMCLAYLGVTVDQ